MKQIKIQKQPRRPAPPEEPDRRTPSGRELPW